METLDGIIHSILFDVVLRATIMRIVAMIPFLGLPIINPVFAFIVGKFAGILFVEMQKAVAFKVIDLQIGAQKDAYNEAVVELKAAIEEKNAEEVEKAKAEFKKRLQDLIHLEPSK
jgi:uncharacterized membrane protein required for colicin V production